MNKVIALLVSLLVAVSAFAPVRTIARANAKLQMAVNNPGPSYWEGAAPPSSVLGVGAKIPSAILGPLSLVALVVGTYSIHESNIFHQLTVTTLEPKYILGSLLVPISWGLHVAAWIQKQNKL